MPVRIPIAILVVSDLLRQMNKVSSADPCRDHRRCYKWEIPGLYSKNVGLKSVIGAPANSKQKVSLVFGSATPIIRIS